VIHYWWLVKADIRRPETYAAIVAALLGARLWAQASRRRATARVEARAPLGATPRT
jgi:sulfoxide reductase heme-binding subunit YedZ